MVLLREFGHWRILFIHASLTHSKHIMHKQTLIEVISIDVYIHIYIYTYVNLWFFPNIFEEYSDVHRGTQLHIGSGSPHVTRQLR